MKFFFLNKKFNFKNFLQSQKFINKVGEISEEEDHHPDIIFGWGYAEIKITTHAIKGLSEITSYSISDINGKLIQNGTTFDRINLENLTKGFYFLTIGNTISKKQAREIVVTNFPTKFGEDLQTISNYELPELMKCENDIPEIHKLAINGKIEIETLIAMDKFYPFIDKHKEKCKVPFVFPDHITKLVKYRPFFVTNVTDFHKDIMKDVLLNK